MNGVRRRSSLCKGGVKEARRNDGRGVANASLATCAPNRGPHMSCRRRPVRRHHRRRPRQLADLAPAGGRRAGAGRPAAADHRRLRRQRRRRSGQARRAGRGRRARRRRRVRPGRRRHAARAAGGRLGPARDRPGVDTSQTLIVNVAGQDRRFIHTFGANAVFAPADIPLDRAAACKVLYLGGYLLMDGVRAEESGRGLRRRPRGPGRRRCSTW